MAQIHRDRHKECTFSGEQMGCEFPGERKAGSLSVSTLCRGTLQTMPHVQAMEQLLKKN